MLLNYPYVLVDWIGNSSVQLLSNVFPKPHTAEQTQNLYKGISKIMISLARIPQPRIGSWTINNNGDISLTNRPLYCHLHQLENWSIPSGIPRDMTYISTDSFYLDLLTGHDNRLWYQANAAFHEEDARGQAKDLILMRALLQRFTDRHFQNGPFIMQLTDMHTSNIFVDKDWNIKNIVDLEWTCCLPLENLLPPFWLTGQSIDRLNGPEYNEFKACYEQFTNLFEREADSTLHLQGAKLMKEALEDGRYWYLNALQTPKGLFNLFRKHLQPFFDDIAKETLCEAISPFWTPGMASFVDLKLKEYANYHKDVHNIFDSRLSGKSY